MLQNYKCQWTSWQNYDSNLNIPVNEDIQTVEDKVKCLSDTRKEIWPLDFKALGSNQTQRKYIDICQKYL